MLLGMSFTLTVFRQRFSQRLQFFLYPLEIQSKLLPGISDWRCRCNENCLLYTTSERRLRSSTEEIFSPNLLSIMSSSASKVPAARSPNISLMLCMHAVTSRSGMPLLFDKDFRTRCQLVKTIIHQKNYLLRRKLEPRRIFASKQPRYVQRRIKLKSTICRTGMQRLKSGEFDERQ